MLYTLIVAALLVCAIMAIRTSRLLTSALWLAGASALVALMMYLLGAPEVAVIELSVGAGLVTVLFVFAINIAGDEPIALKPTLPKPLAWVMVILAVVLTGWLSLPSFNITLPEGASQGLADMLWENRSLDIILQALLVFSGVLGVIGLLAEARSHHGSEGEA